MWSVCECPCEWKNRHISSTIIAENKSNTPIYLLVVTTYYVRCSALKQTSVYWNKKKNAKRFYVGYTYSIRWWFVKWQWLLLPNWYFVVLCTYLLIVDRVQHSTAHNHNGTNTWFWWAMSCSIRIQFFFHHINKNHSSFNWIFLTFPAHQSIQLHHEMNQQFLQIIHYKKWIE